MSIAITDDHRALADTASDFLLKAGARGAARALLEAPEETLPPFWGELAKLGWLGLHVPESHGGSGYGLPELVVVVEELGRAIAPGPFVPTVIASGQPSPGAPTMFSAATLAPSNSTCPNSVVTPLIICSGRCCTPGCFIPMINAEMPRCRLASGSVRANSRHQSATSE